MSKIVRFISKIDYLYLVWCNKITFDMFGKRFRFSKIAYQTSIKALPEIVENLLRLTDFQSYHLT